MSSFAVRMAAGRERVASSSSTSLMRLTFGTKPSCAGAGAGGAEEDAASGCGRGGSAAAVAPAGGAWDTSVGRAAGAEEGCRRWLSASPLRVKEEVSMLSLRILPVRGSGAPAGPPLRRMCSRIDFRSYACPYGVVTGSTKSSCVSGQMSSSGCEGSTGTGSGTGTGAVAAAAEEGAPLASSGSGRASAAAAAVAASERGGAASPTSTATSCSSTHVEKLKTSRVRNTPAAPGRDTRRTACVWEKVCESCTGLPLDCGVPLRLKQTAASAGWYGSSTESSVRGCLPRFVSRMLQSRLVPAATGALGSRQSSICIDPSLEGCSILTSKVRSRSSSAEFFLPTT
mmetsp:Transcript_3623/g.10137  ORF Transcript_3623/g.10137 Transcript_3623/m.10137 type:complete len:342 (-) Transcript_3623:3869-4894(-)